MKTYRTSSTTDLGRPGVLDLAGAQRLIASQAIPLGAEEVTLPHVAGRVAYEPLRAPAPLPAFSRATRDGFALWSGDLATPAAWPVSLKITGEVAAGSTLIPTLCEKEAISIMTGAMVPHRANQIVPLESCRVTGEIVQIRSPAAPGAFIRKKGSDLRRGQTLIRAGQVIQPEHLPLMAQMGIASVSVYRLPKVAVLCTGSELLDLPATPKPGQIISGNPFLLAALIRRNGGIPLDLGTVEDDLNKIQSVLKKTLAGPADLVITTGGMGPGKFDCIAQALEGAGVKIFYRRLAVSPGRATLFGVQHGKPVFALPGPPPAVFPLFHELVIPGLRRMQGNPHHLLRKLRVTLQQDLDLKKKGCQHLKTGVLTSSKGILAVRPAKRHEPAEAIMLIPANRRRIRAGEKITVHLLPSGSNPLS